MGDAARQLRHVMRDPLDVCRRLGLLDGAQRQGGGVLIRCPAHDDTTPSCSVTVGPDGTLRAKCFACDWSGDVLGLVAVVNGWDLERDFPRVLEAAADVTGRRDLLDDAPRSGERRQERPRPVPVPDPLPVREYPPADQVAAMWAAAGCLQDDADASATLALRRIDPVAAHSMGLARVLALRTGLPPWARFKGRSWGDTGHRLVLRVYDHEGTLRSVRARRVTDSDTPKCLPPSGHRAEGLVLANDAGRRMLADGQRARKLWIVEGETDFLTLATRSCSDAVIGIGSGSWSEAHARRVPFGTAVVIATDHDPAGDKYAAAVAKSLAGRARVVRA